jgi:hypothetical protein
VRARQRGGHDAPPVGDGDFALRHGLELGRQLVAESEAEAQGAEDFRWRCADHDRDRDHVEGAFGEDGERDHGLPAQCGFHRCLRQSLASRSAAVAERQPVPIGHRQQVRMGLGPIVCQQRLDGRRIAGLRGRLQLRQVGDQMRDERQGLRSGCEVVLDLRAGLVEAALQLGLRLPRDALRDEVDCRADADHRHCGAGQEHPVLEGGQQLHLHRNRKSASTALFAGTSIGRVARVSPSCQAATV